MKKRIFASCAILALLGGCSPDANVKPTDAAQIKAEPAGKTEYGTFGLDISEIDPTINPGDDFYRYLNGKWMDRFEIPADKTSFGAFSSLADRSEQQVRSIIQDAAKTTAKKGSVQQKIGDLYASFMDDAAIEANGMDGVQGDLDQIMAADSHEAIVRIMGRPDLSSNGPFGGYITTDSKHPTRYAYVMVHSGLGLPDRDYYLDQDERSVTLRAGYLAHITKMLELAHIENASNRAKAIVALETKLAAAHWDKVDRRNRDKTYNKMTMDELMQLAPEYPWMVANAAAGIDVKEVIISEKSAFPIIAKIFAQASVDDWKSYLSFHVLSSNSSYLPAAFDQENFNFFSKQLSGQQQQRDRWKRAVSLVNSTLGDAIGQMYVERHFPAASKKAMDDLVKNVRTALGQRIDQLDWMSDATKKEARTKLAAFTPKIGYPDKWKDYSSMDMNRSDVLANVRAASVWSWQQDLDKLGGPVDKSEWFMNPQTVNAYYSPDGNEVVFPAAILQAPFFDPYADAAVNYGAIGAVIGHEMGHGFDDQGAKSDGNGKLRDWWSDTDKAAFEARAEQLGKQYDQYVPLKGYTVNGKFTMGENIGDLGGLTFALAAYHLYLDGKEAPVLGGLTGDQRLFLSWAQVWRRKYRDENLIYRLKNDPHSPAEFRTNGVVRNIDGWYDAFDIKEGDALYLPPEKRVRIW